MVLASRRGQIHGGHYSHVKGDEAARSTRIIKKLVVREIRVGKLNIRTAADEEKESFVLWTKNEW